MKKLFLTLLMPVLALAMLSSCDDVPAPYYVLNPEEADTSVEGEGTVETPFTVKDALNIISAGTYSSEKVYVAGIITQIDEVNASYGNATYYIADESAINEDGSVSQQLEVYRGSGLNGNKLKEGDIKVGDRVIVYGQLTLYGSTPEVTQGSILYMLNDQYSDTPSDPTEGEATGDGSRENPFNSVAANQLCASLADGAKSAQKYYVKGKVASIKENYDGVNPKTGEPYGNATFYISDDGSSNGQFYVYRALYLGNEKYTNGDLLKEGDNVIIYGYLMKYVSQYGTTYETSQNEAFLFSLNGYSIDGGDDDPDPTPSGEATGDGTLNNPYNSVAAINVCNQLSDGANTQNDVYVKGKVVSIKENYDVVNANTGEKYGNITCYISDDGTTNNQFYIFRALYFNKKKYESGTMPKVGDDVIFCGKLTNYRGNTPETVQNEAYLYSLNGETGDSINNDPNPNPDPDPTPTPTEGEGDGTMNSPYNVAAAQSVYNSGATATKAFVHGWVVGYVNGNSLNANTATFDYPEKAGETEVLIADDPDETDFTKCIPVQLPKGEFREKLDLYNNGHIMYRDITFYGSIEKYFGVCGIKSPTYAYGDGIIVGTLE